MYSNSTVSSRYLRDIPSPLPSPVRDPYNYTLNDELSRQSMINKLPGKKHIDLGSQPQIVILFQAAEIQRLNNVQSSHRLLNKGVNKQHLDRHSYEIQIKQLTAIIDDLKQQKKGLQKRIQQLNNAVSVVQTRVDNTSDIAVLNNKYQRALLQIGKMYDDNTKLQQEINQINWQLAQEKSKLPKDSPLLSPSSTKPTAIIKTNTNTNTVQNLSQIERRQITEEATRQLKLQISQLETRNSQNVVELRQSFARQMEQYKMRMAHKDNIKNEQLSQELASANNKITKLVKQVTDFKSQKWNMETKIREQQIKIREYESKIKNHEYDNNKFTDQINELNGRITQLKNSAYFPEESLKLGKYNTVHDSVNIVNSNAHEHNQQSMSIKINKMSFANHQLSVNSSFNNNPIESTHTQEQLENNLAMISQQLERLTELVKQKNKEIQLLQSKLGEISTQHQKQLIQIRIKYETEIRREVKKRDEDSDRYEKQIEKYRRKVQENELSAIQNNSKLHEQLIKIKQEQRSICQAVFDKKIKSLETQYGRDRDQISRLRKQLSNLHEQIDALHQNSLQLKSQRRIEELKYLQKMQEEQRKYEYKLKDMEMQYKRKIQTHDNQFIDVKQVHAQQLAKSDRKIQEQTELIKQIQVKHQQQIRTLTSKYESTIRQMEMDYEVKQHKNSQQIRQKQRQISQMADTMEHYNNQHSQILHSQHETLLRKLDYLGEETSHAKNTIIETISMSKNSKLQEMELTRIDNSLEYLSNQFTTLSKQILQAHLEQQQSMMSTPTFSNYYSEQYVKQLQAECDNYLSIINGKMCSNDSTLKQIWEEIENNNKYNREEQEKWRSMFHKQQAMLEQYQDEQRKWEEIRYESEKIKYDCFKLQQAIQHNDLKYQQETQQLKNEMLSNHKSDVEKYTAEIEKLFYQLKNKENIIADKDTIINEYVSKLSQFGKQQNQQITNLTTILQNKSQQLLVFSTEISQYKNKYIQTKEKLKTIQNIIEKVLKDSQTDIINMDKMEKENIALKKNVDTLKKEAEAERDQKTKIIQRSRQQVRKITQQLTQDHLTQNQIAYQEQDQQNNKIISLQRQFNRLQNIISQLRKDNYQLTRQNYDGSTQDYVNREFAYTKIRQLNKEIERLMSENIDLKDDLSRCRLEIVEESTADRRQQQNLALMMLLFVEIESLRKRQR